MSFPQFGEAHFLDRLTALKAMLRAISWQKTATPLDALFP